MKRTIRRERIFFEWLLKIARPFAIAKIKKKPREQIFRMHNIRDKGDGESKRVRRRIEKPGQMLENSCSQQRITIIGGYLEQLA